jgi:hypothetical protein
MGVVQAGRECTTRGGNKTRLGWRQHFLEALLSQRLLEA